MRQHHFELYCKDIESVKNYDKAKADNFVGWCIHHRLQTWNSDGERRLVDISAAELKALGMYYNRPPEELIFMKVEDHASLHNKGEHNHFYGKRHTDEVKQRISENNKGKYIGEKNPMYGKKHSDESKKKMSLVKKGRYTGENNHFYGKHHNAEAKQKMSKYAKNRSNEHKQKLGKATTERNIGRHWYNNGIINMFCFDCPPGFIPGGLKRK